MSEAFCGVLALLLSYRVVHGIFYGIPYFESQGTFKNTVNIMQVHCKTGNFYPSLPVIVEIRHGTGMIEDQRLVHFCLHSYQLQAADCSHGIVSHRKNLVHVQVYSEGTRRLTASRCIPSQGKFPALRTLHCAPFSRERMQPCTWFETSEYRQGPGAV